MVTEQSFSMFECLQFVPDAANASSNAQCRRCGVSQTLHCKITLNSSRTGDQCAEQPKWRIVPSNVFDNERFDSLLSTNVCKYVRLTYDTDPAMIYDLLVDQWCLQPPKSVIALIGAKTNCELDEALQKKLSHGIRNILKLSSASYILMPGLRKGPHAHMDIEWAVVKNMLDGRGCEMIGIGCWRELVRDPDVHLNIACPYFLLVDGNDECGSADTTDEHMLENLMQFFVQRSSCGPNRIPLVSLIVSGTLRTLKTAVSLVCAVPVGVPLIVYAGTGGVADLIANAYHLYCAGVTANKNTMRTLLQSHLTEISKSDPCPCTIEEIFNDLWVLVEHHTLLSVFSLKNENRKNNDLDYEIFKRLFNAPNLNDIDQLRLAISWNQSEFADKEIHEENSNLTTNDMFEAMMQSLISDQDVFVEMFLKNGLKVDKFVTVERLERLYNSNSRENGAHLLKILKSIRSGVHADHKFTLYDIGLIVNKLMGGSFKCSYSRREFRDVYDVKSRPIQAVNGKEQPLLLPTVYHEFKYPFNDLFQWAVLTKRQKIAILMWRNGEESLAKALVGCRLYRAMATACADETVDLLGHSEQFATIALRLFKHFHRTDKYFANYMLIHELKNWSGQTCMSLAILASHRKIIAHPCAQSIITDLWLGRMRMRDNINMKIIAALIFPPYITKLNFKSKDEIRKMPKIAEELFDRHSSDEDSESTSTSCSTSTYDALSLNGRNKCLALLYFAFLVVHSLDSLVKLPRDRLKWTEYATCFYCITLLCEQFREFCIAEATNVRNGLMTWLKLIWNPLDFFFCLFHLVGFWIRYSSGDPREYYRLFYGFSSSYFTIRIFRFGAVDENFSSFLMIMFEMSKKLLYFVAIIFVYLMAFGVVRQGLIKRRLELDSSVLSEIVIQPYFMLYGETFPEHIYPKCGEDPNMQKCIPGRWLTPVLMGLYFLMASFVLINIINSYLNNQYAVMTQISSEVWKFQRYATVLRYRHKPRLPPPFICLSHAFRLLRIVLRKFRSLLQRQPSNNRDRIFGYYGFKLILNPSALRTLENFDVTARRDLIRTKKNLLRKRNEELTENALKKFAMLNKTHEVLTLTLKAIRKRFRKRTTRPPGRFPRHFLSR